MHVTKRNLGEGYIVATGVVLGAVLVGQTMQGGTTSLLWGVVWGLPAFFLVGALYWLQQLELDSEQVWGVAQYSAGGLGIGTLLVIVLDLTTAISPATTADSVLLGTTLSSLAVAGALVGVVHGLTGARQNLRLRNAVLSRVLRHNLRNDMTVLQCQLDEIEDAAGPDQQAAIERAREKVDSFVELTDKVRRASVTTDGGTTRHEPVDVSALVDRRVSALEDSHEDLDAETELSGQALAYVDSGFELVVDNVVESALSADDGPTELCIGVDTRRDSVQVYFEDHDEAIPDADLAAVAMGPETDLAHGLGVELWLVRWLVESNDGTVSFELDGDQRRITVDIDRAASGLI